MRDDLPKEKWLRIRGKKRAHWGILTLDDLPKNCIHQRKLKQIFPKTIGNIAS